MKQNVVNPMANILLCVLGMTVLALPLFTQNDFNTEDKKMIVRFKLANPHHISGNTQFSKGKLDKAEKEFLKTLALMPEHADASYMLAQIQLKRKEFSQALASITAAKKNNAVIAKFRATSHQLYLSQMRQQRQDLEEQKQRIEEILSTLPSNSRARLTYETIVQAIIKDIQKIDSKLNAPVPPLFEIPAGYYYVHGNVLFQMGMPTDAAAQYQEAIRLDPGLGNAYNNLALVSFSQGKYQEALGCLLRAEGAGVKINPEFKRAIEVKIPQQ